MPELLQTADSTQARYAAGLRLGEVARQIFDPSGQGLTFDVVAQGAAGVVAHTQLEIAHTPRTLAHRSPLFEARFEAAGARATSTRHEGHTRHERHEGQVLILLV